MKSVERTWKLVLFACLTAGLIPQTTDADARPVLWQDDRGYALPADAELEVCRIAGLERQCETTSAERLPGELEGFDSLRVEGPRHGPVRWTAGDLARDQDGRWIVRVPRKARLTVAGLDHPRAVLSLYEQTDPTFRAPFDRWAGDLATPFYVPAGAFVAAAEAPGAATRLWLLELAPGSDRRLRYEDGAGGALLLRTVSGEVPEAVAGVEIEVTPSPGYAAAPDVVRRGETNSAGLLVVDRLALPLAVATARHLEHLETVVGGIAASNRGFVYRSLELEKGGAFVARVRVEGEIPSAGSECRVLRFDRVPGLLPEPPEVVARAAVAPDGTCRAAALRAGSYTLRALAVGAGDPRLDLPLEITENGETALDLNLERVRLEGTVYRGTEAAEGYRVLATPLGTLPTSADRDDYAGAATSGDDGAYEIVLWSPGEHVVTVDSPSGWPVSVRRTDLETGDNTVDFHLGEMEIVGKVVDPEGRPVSEARVMAVRDEMHHRIGFSGADGAFGIALEKDEGVFEIHARQVGYTPSEPLVLEVTPGQPPTPIVLTLEPSPEVFGRIVGASGAPIPGAGVATFGVELGDPVWVGQTRADAAGLFLASRSRDLPTRLYYSGSGCPLTARPALPVRPPDGEPPAYPCASAPANLDLTLLGPDDAPYAGARLLLRRGDVLVPQQVLDGHLSRLGVATTSDAAGRFFVPALEPGRYEIYLAAETSPLNILIGARIGYLGIVEAQPWVTATVELRTGPEEGR